MEDSKIIKNWNYKQFLFSKTNWARYYSEYKLAIDNIFERSDESQTTVLTLPILFLIRHSLEIAFKMNLIELEKISGIKAAIDFSGAKAHILSTLHKEFENQISIIIKKKALLKSIQKEFETRNNELKDFRDVFDKLDNFSFAFRYPVENNGKTPSFKKEDVINVADIIPAYKNTQVLLQHTINVLLDPANKSENIR